MECSPVPTSPRGQRSRTLPRRQAGALLLGGLLGSAVPSHAAEADGAAEFIHELGRSAVATLQDPSLTRPERLDRLTSLLNKATDLPLVARLVLGRYWREANARQREDYTRLFVALVIKTMAKRLDSYGGETFTISGTRPAGDKDTIVSTRILRRRSGAQPIDVDWRVRTKNGRHAVVDVVAEGVSMVITQRAEVSDLVARAGLDGLIQTMRERLARPS